MRHRHSKQNSNYCLPIVFSFFVTARGGTETEDRRDAALWARSRKHWSYKNSKRECPPSSTTSDLSVTCPLNTATAWGCLREFRSRRPVKYSLLVKIFPQLLKIQTMTFMFLNKSMQSFIMSAVSISCELIKSREKTNKKRVIRKKSAISLNKVYHLRLTRMVLCHYCNKNSLRSEHSLTVTKAFCNPDYP